MNFGDAKEGEGNECATVRQRQADDGGDRSNFQSSGSGDMEIKGGRSGHKRLLLTICQPWRALFQEGKLRREGTRLHINSLLE
ncbi:hypothetical protein AVEN_87036-1 [Araneus ventricosus]|uniref:Uncharacterized protein n=1 Tax=Araneus ventricosus TaxID=182803 RepID=A0A4Y2SGK5_ARAVE|nr:hypothetical protein AVEN_87036-1 [Araneus ventricosus]